MNEKMFKLIVSFSVVMIFISKAEAKVAPNYITPCPGLKSDCLKKTIQEIVPLFANGIPDLGIDSVDPLRQDHISLTLPGGMKIEFSNGNMTGLRKCVIDSATFSKGEGDIKLHCDLTIKGLYKASGRILIVTINGDGNAKIKIKNASIYAKLKFEDKVRDGVTFYEIKQSNTKFAYGDKVTFQLTNLFKGSPELSEAVLQFLNQNWKQIAEEFGQPLVDRLIDDVFVTIKKFFKVVPKNELFIDI